MKLISNCIQRSRHWLALAVLIALASCGTQQSSPVATPASDPPVSSPSAPPTAADPTITTPTPTPFASPIPSSPITSASPTVDPAGTVSLQGGRVTFKLPPGFTPLTPEEINLKFPPRGGNQPQYVYGNERRNVAIAITFSNANVSPQQLPELQTVLRKTIGQTFPNAEWKSEEMTTINNTPWAHLAFVTQAIDTKIRNDAYFTSFDGRMLGFNFNSTLAQYESNKAALEQTRDSIVVR